MKDLFGGGGAGVADGRDQRVTARPRLIRTALQYETVKVDGSSDQCKRSDER